MFLMKLASAFGKASVRYYIYVKARFSFLIVACVKKAYSATGRWQLHVVVGIEQFLPTRNMDKPTNNATECRFCLRIFTQKTLFPV